MKSDTIRFVATDDQIATLKKAVVLGEFEDMSKMILFAIEYYLRCEFEVELPPSRKRGYAKKTKTPQTSER